MSVRAIGIGVCQGCREVLDVAVKLGSSRLEAVKPIVAVKLCVSKSFQAVRVLWCKVCCLDI